MTKEISFKITALILGVLILVFAIAFYILAWEEPTGVPPTENVPIPLNVGNAGQAKVGGLMLNTGGAGAGLIVLGERTDPVGGICPDGYDWYDYDSDGVIENGECQRTSLYTKDNGRVGVGIVNPSEKLDVDGYVKGQTGLCIGDECRNEWPAHVVPTGMVAAFIPGPGDPPCPGGWSQVIELNEGRFPRGADPLVAGNTGGSDAPAFGLENVWGCSFGVPFMPPVPPLQCTDNCDICCNPEMVRGTLDPTTPTLPPYLNVVWCRKD